MSYDFRYMSLYQASPYPLARAKAPQGEFKLDEDASLELVILPL